MAEAVHPAATPYVPGFVALPGETDALMVVLAIILAVSVFAFGVFYWRLHHLPDHIAHKSQKLQAELVGVLCLISLFTHMHIFWIIALLLAVIEVPDFGTPLHRIAGATEKLAGFKPGEGDVDIAPHVVNREIAGEIQKTHEAHAIEQGIGVVPLSARAGVVLKTDGQRHP